MTFDWTQLRGQTTFIVGYSKGVGKTTFLAFALARLRRLNCRLAFLTTGVSGGSRAACSQFPSVVAEAGDVLVTTDQAIRASDGNFCIQQVFGDRTVMGRLLLAEALRCGSVELVGPEHNQRLTEILRYLTVWSPDRAILVDGAVDRLTPIGSSASCAYVPIFSVRPESIRQVADRVRLTVLLDSLPRGDSTLPECVEVPGALTRSQVADLPDTCRSITIQDVSRVFLDYEQMARLCRRVAVFVRHVHTMLFMVVNLRDVPRNTFKQNLGSEVSDRHILFNPFLEAALC